MKASQRKTAPCPACIAMPGVNIRTGKECNNCGGSGQVPTQFPYDYWYTINLTATQAVPAGASTPTLQISGSTPNPNQQGTNPARLQLGSDAPFEWVFSLVKVTSPTVIGDASAWLALQLVDASSEALPFSSSPIIASLFAGDAKNPWPHLDPPTFGEQTQLALQGWPINYTSNVFQLGVGDGTATSFTGTIYGPVLQGSIVAGDTTAGVTGTDNGNGVIAGTGIAAGSGITSYVGPGVALTVTVKFSSAPALNDKITVTFSQGCALINAQFALQGFYLKSLTPGAAMSASPVKVG